MYEWKQYEVVCMLGRGKYGIVSRARHKKLGSLVALKSILGWQQLNSLEERVCSSSSSKSSSPVASDEINNGAPDDVNNECQVSKQRSSLHNEARVLAALSHPGLVSLVEICVGDNGDLVLAMEDLGGMTLTGLVQKNRHTRTGLCECLVGCIANHITRALIYLHSRGYLHRDIKPDNIMVQNTENCFPHAKLIDLGLSIEFSYNNLPNTSTTRAGTPSFMAPELMMPHKSYGPKVDVFSLGASLYYALVGDAPFMPYTSEGGQRSSTSVFGMQVQHEDALEQLSPDVSTIIKSSLQLLPDCRCSAEDISKSYWLKYSVVGSSFAQHSNSYLPVLVGRLALEQPLPVATRACMRQHCTYFKNYLSFSEKSSCSSSAEMDSSTSTSFSEKSSCSSSAEMDSSTSTSFSDSCNNKQQIKSSESSGDNQLISFENINYDPYKTDDEISIHSCINHCSSSSVGKNTHENVCNYNLKPRENNEDGCSIKVCDTTDNNCCNNSNKGEAQLGYYTSEGEGQCKNICNTNEHSEFRSGSENKKTRSSCSDESSNPKNTSSSEESDSVCESAGIGDMEGLSRAGENMHHVFGLKDCMCHVTSPDFCCCVAPCAADAWEAVTVDAVAQVLQQDSTTVLQRMTRKPWGEAAGIYNLLKMKDRLKFSSVITDVIMNMQEESRDAVFNHTL